MAPPRPRWEANKKSSSSKAPKKEKNNAKIPSTQQHEAAAPAPCIPLELQQLLLNIFKNAFKERFAEIIKPLIQEVKGHLYNRDFTTAFGKPEYLDAYAARWSASRALGYAELLLELKEKLWINGLGGNEGEDGRSGEDQRRKVVCLGGGAGAELVALGGLQHQLSSSSSGDKDSSETLVEVVTIDLADWGAVTNALFTQITTPPPLSKYASAAVQAANRSLTTANVFQSSFHCYDILSTEFNTLKPLLDGSSLITLMFTLNELYSTSLSLTQKFLLQLTSGVPTGTLLLVVDSPGSYSTVTLNGAEKRYPMQWLLDHTLLKSASSEKYSKKNDDSTSWEKIHEDESRWFRLDPSTKYPIDLENMRMQVHLYRRK